MVEIILFLIAFAIGWVANLLFTTWSHRKPTLPPLSTDRSCCILMDRKLKQVHGILTIPAIRRSNIIIKPHGRSEAGKYEESHREAEGAYVYRQVT